MCGQTLPVFPPPLSLLYDIFSPPEKRLIPSSARFSSSAPGLVIYERFLYLMSFEAALVVGLVCQAGVEGQSLQGKGP